MQITSGGDLLNKRVALQWEQNEELLKSGGESEKEIVMH